MDPRIHTNSYPLPYVSTLANMTSSRLDTTPTADLSMEDRSPLMDLVRGNNNIVIRDYRCLWRHLMGFQQHAFGVSNFSLFENSNKVKESKV